jgi:hypothetical protein
MEWKKCNHNKITNKQWNKLESSRARKKLLLFHPRVTWNIGNIIHHLMLQYIYLFGMYVIKQTPISLIAGSTTSLA